MKTRLFLPGFVRVESRDTLSSLVRDKSKVPVRELPQFVEQVVGTFGQPFVPEQHRKSLLIATATIPDN
jgi:hypothetical protein